LKYARCLEVLRHSKFCDALYLHEFLRRNKNW
jgi:hypothetical protein